MLAREVEGSVGASSLSRVSGLHVIKLDGAFDFRLLPNSCGCTLLARKADSGSTLIPFDAEVLPGLERAVKLLAEKARRFRFRVVWLLDPDELLPAVRIPVKDLVKLVRENQIENGREYVVGRVA